MEELPPRGMAQRGTAPRLELIDPVFDNFFLLVNFYYYTRKVTDTLLKIDSIGVN